MSTLIASGQPVRLVLRKTRHADFKLKGLLFPFFFSFKEHNFLKNYLIWLCLCVRICSRMIFHLMLHIPDSEMGWKTCNFMCMSFTSLLLCWQLKHCGKQVYDILIPLIKNLELQPNRHLLELVSSLDPSAHTESVSLCISVIEKKIECLVILTVFC